MQLEIHYKENNDESQAHLDANRKHYTKQAMDVLRHLQTIGMIDSDIAREKYKIEHLARRIADLKANGNPYNIDGNKFGKKLKSYFIKQQP